MVEDTDMGGIDGAGASNAVSGGDSACKGTPIFNDGKAPDALRTIGEVSRALGIPAHVLRYWEEQFPALRPVKRSGGRRYYRLQDIATIIEIDRLVRAEGYTLRGAGRAIARKPGVKQAVAGQARARQAGDAHVDAGDLAGVARALEAIRNELAGALSRA